MQSWHQKKTGEYDPRAFWGGIAACGSLVFFLTFIGILLTPLPRTALDRLPQGALMAISLPPNATLRDAAFTAWELEPIAAEALLTFYMRERPVSEALVSPRPSMLILFPPTTSGTAQFALSLEPQAEKRVLLRLAATYPTKRPYTLPDGSTAQELIFDPQTTEQNLVWDAEALRLRFSDAHTPFYLVQTGDSFVFSTKIQPIGSVPSTDVCLSGMTAALPTREIKPIHAYFNDFPTLMIGMYSIPLFRPHFSTDFFYKNSRVSLKKYCFTNMHTFLSTIF